MDPLAEMYSSYSPYAYVGNNPSLFHNSTFGGVPGAAWGVGWEIGRAITNIPGYHENVRLPVRRFLGIRR